MTEAEIRQAKADLHYEVISQILSYGGTWQDEAKLYLYLIELASTELQHNYKEVYKNLLTNS